MRDLKRVGSSFGENIKDKRTFLVWVAMCYVIICSFGFYNWVVLGEAMTFDGGYELGSFGQSSMISIFNYLLIP